MIAKRIAAGKKRFLKHFRQCGNISVAASRAGIGRTAIYEWRNKDSGFATLWDETHELAFDDLEATMLERAKNGSDTSAIFLAKARWPQKYRDRLAVEIRNSPVLKVVVSLFAQVLEQYVPPANRRAAIDRLYMMTSAVIGPMAVPPALLAAATERAGTGESTTQ